MTAAFSARIDDAAAFALANRVLLLRTVSGVGLDVALGGLRFEARAIERSSPFRFPPDVHLRTPLQESKETPELLDRLDRWRRELEA